jgi:hypothetical protein
VACGKSCVDIATSTSDCGACSQACQAGQLCTEGVCKKPIVLPPGVPPPGVTSASTPFDVTPGKCNEYESRPVLSAGGLLFQADGNETVSWALSSAPDVWALSNSIKADPTQADSPVASLLPAPPPACLPPAWLAQVPASQESIENDCTVSSNGDIWATTSGFSGEDYILERTEWNFWMPQADPSKEPVDCTDKSDCNDTTSGTNICSTTGQCACGAPPGHTQKVCLIHNASPGGVVVSDTTIEDKTSFPKALWVDLLDGSDDGLTYDYDLGGTSLWGVAGCGWPTGLHKSGNKCVALFTPCAGSTIGGADCPQVAFPGLTGGFAALLGPADAGRSPDGHVSVVTNPCTHHALVSFVDHDETSGYVVVEAVDHQGAIVGRWELPINKPRSDTVCPIGAGTATSTTTNCSQNPLCPSPIAASTDTACTTDGSEVSHLTGRAPLDVETAKVNGAMQCTVYVGYNEALTETAPGESVPFIRQAATLASLDVTPDSTGLENPKAKLTQLTQIDPSYGESMDGTPEVSRFGQAMGFIYAQRDPTGTWEMLRARVTTDPTFSTWTDMPVSGWQSGQVVWLGDNIAQLRGGLPGGQLLATWPNWNNLSNCKTIDGSVLDVTFNGTTTYVPGPDVPPTAEVPAPKGIPSVVPNDN